MAAEEWCVVSSRSSRPSPRNRSSLADEEVTKARDYSKLSQQKRNSSNRSSDQAPFHQRRQETSCTSERQSLQGKERGRDAPQQLEPHSQTGQSAAQTPVIRLMRRPVSQTPPLSEVTTSASNTDSQVTGKRSDDDMREKIGAPIIRHLPRTGLCVHAQRRLQSSAVIDLQAQSGKGLTTKQHGLYSTGNDEVASSRRVPDRHILEQDMTREREQRRGGLLVLKTRPEESREQPVPAVALNLSSDDQWPSISSRDEGGSGQGVRLTNSEAKGWSDIIKKKPSMHAVKTEPVSTQSGEGSGEDEGENPIISSGESGETKKKRRRKKKGSGEAATQGEKKLDKPPLLDLSQYMTQAPVRPVLNKKDVKNAKEGSGASGNVLDSTAPAMRRGKEREEPKAKKPTNLRKIIDKEKEAKRKLREQGLDIPPDLDVMKDEKDQSDQSHPSADIEPVQPVQATPTNQPVRRIHSKKFREYCSHMVTDEINAVVELLLQDLVRFQDRQYHRDPIRAKSKRRYVCGLREVHKHLTLDKLKCVIIPPNLDHIQSTGGIDERVFTILSLCREKGVQVIHAMSRRRVAVILKKKYKIGCVGIFSYDGAETHYKRLMTLVEDTTEIYQRIALTQAKDDFTHELKLTTHDPEPSDSNSIHTDDSQDDESSVPDPGNGTGTLPTESQVMGTPWRIFFPEKTQMQKANSTSDLTNQNSHDIADDSTNQNVHDITHDVTSYSANKRADGRTADSDLTSDLTSPTAGNVTTDFHVHNTKGFHWNVDATEFIPSFLSQ